MSIYATVLHSDYFFSRKFLGWYAVFILTIYNNDFLGIKLCKYTCTFQSNIYMVKDWVFLRCDSLNPHNFIYELGAILEKVAPSSMNGSREIKRYWKEALIVSIGLVSNYVSSRDRWFESCWRHFIFLPSSKFACKLPKYP